MIKLVSTSKNQAFIIIDLLQMSKNPGFDTSNFVQTKTFNF